MKHILLAALLISTAVAPAQACSLERFKWLIVSTAKVNQYATAAKRNSDYDPQTYIDAVQTLTEWAAALDECSAERAVGNDQ
jgi:hypothetical protein